jgi:hypothetical protein
MGDCGCGGGASDPALAGGPAQAGATPQQASPNVPTGRREPCGSADRKPERERLGPGSEAAAPYYGAWDDGTCWLGGLSGWDFKNGSCR